MLPVPTAVKVEVRIAPPPHHVPSGCMGCFANRGVSPATCRRGICATMILYFLTGKYVGPTVSLGIVAEEGIPCERSLANIPRRQVAGKPIPSDKSPGNLSPATSRRGKP
nr:hypothetical protein [Tanacetum cinerariifolium]